MREPPPNNPLKVPIFVFIGILGVAMIVLGVSVPAWWMAAWGLGNVILSVAAIRAIRQGRNPWWIRAPMDRRWPR